MIGLKYCLAVRTTLIDKVLFLDFKGYNVYHVILEGLTDSNDDICAVSACKFFINVSNSCSYCVSFI